MVEVLCLPELWPRPPNLDQSSPLPNIKPSSNINPQRNRLPTAAGNKHMERPTAVMFECEERLQFGYRNVNTIKFITLCSFNFYGLNFMCFNHLSLSNEYRILTICNLNFLLIRIKLIKLRIYLKSVLIIIIIMD